MFTEHMFGRQPGDDSGNEKHPRDDDPEIIHLARPKENIGNHIDGRHELERKQCRKREF